MGLFNLKFTRGDNNGGFGAFGGNEDYIGFDPEVDMGDGEYNSMHTEAAVEETKPLAVALKIVNPKGYDEAPTIADFLLGGNTVLLNIEGLDRMNAVRLLDYLNGATHMIGGVMTKIGKTTLVIAPKNVDVSSIEAMVGSAE